MCFTQASMMRSNEVECLFTPNILRIDTWKERFQIVYHAFGCCTGVRKDQSCFVLLNELIEHIIQRSISFLERGSNKIWHRRNNLDICLFRKLNINDRAWSICTNQEPSYFF